LSAFGAPKSASEASARDSQRVNSEKLFSSLNSAECTEVGYATEQYSESPPSVGTKTDNGVPAQRKRGRNFAQHIQVELDSSSDEAPTASKSIYLLEIHSQIDHNEMLQGRLAHSTKILRDVERLQVAVGDGNAPAPQAVRPPPIDISAPAILAV
jgi:hypothetical protein